MNCGFIAGALGGWELAVILVAALLLFGARRLPELARALGQSIREFKKASREIEDEIKSAGQTPEPGSKPDRTTDRSADKSSTPQG